MGARRVPCRLLGADEELGAVGVGPGVGHGQDARPGVLQLEVLVRKLVAVDRLPSGSVVVGEVAALQAKHSNRDEPRLGPIWTPTGPGQNLTWHMKPGMMRWKPEPL